MSPGILRICGIAFLVLAVVVAALDFWRGASLTAFFLPALWIFVGVALLMWAKGRRL